MVDAINNILSHVSDFELIIVRIAIYICDLLGVIVLMTSVIKSLYRYFHRELHVKMILAQGIALALEFKLAGEVLRTVMVRTINELIILGAIVLMRGAIMLLIHWEIKTEKAEAEKEKSAEGG